MSFQNVVHRRRQKKHDDVEIEKKPETNKHRRPLNSRLLLKRIENNPDDDIDEFYS